MRHVRQRQVSRRSAWVGALLVCAACGSPTGPSEVQLDFFTKVVFGLPSLATTATPAPREIEVQGLLVTPHTAYTVSGGLVPVTGRMDVVITAVKSGQGLPYATQNYYAARLLSLKSGSYALRVLHVVERDQMDTTVVFNRTVTVP